MATQLGRISGPLLFANLLRDGVDLDFKNTVSDPSLLHLNVNNKRIGINTEAPSRDLSVNNTINSINAVARDQTDIADISISDSQIDSLVGNLILQAQDYINFTGLQVDDVRFDFNNISTHTTDTNVELRPAGTGIVELFSNLRVNADLHATGDITLDGNIIFGDDSTEDTVSVLSNIDSDVVPTLDNSYLLGEPSRRWNKIYIKDFNVADPSSALNSDNITVTGTTIQTTQSDSNLELISTGDVRLEDIIATDSEIYTDSGPIVINIGSDSVVIDATGSLLLPVGPTSERTNQAGDLRYNTDYNIVEGYSTANVTYGGVFSDDRQTRLDAGEDIFYFTINGLTLANLNNTRFKTPRVETNDIAFDNNTVSTLSSNSDLEIRPSSGNSLRLADNLRFEDNRIVNDQNNGYNISHSRFGYAKLSATTAMTLAVGDNTSRPSSPEIGQTRYNTDRGLTETWDGTEWIRIIGTEDTVSAAEFEDIQNIWTLILG